jgi:hypothetical protein
LTRRDGFPVERGMTRRRVSAVWGGCPVEPGMTAAMVTPRPSVIRHSPVIPAKAGIHLSLPQAAFGLALI